MRFWEERAFPEAVKTHFAFLGELGYRCTKTGETYALFRSRRIYVHVIYFPGLSHIYIEIGHRYRANCYYDALDLLKFMNAQVNKYQFEARTQDILAERLEKLAELIRSNLSELLRGETEIFRKVRRGRRNVLSFNDYYFQRLGFRKKYYVNNETGRRYTEEHSLFGLFYAIGVFLGFIAAMAFQIPPGYYSVILCLGVVLYPFKYFFTTFEEYLDPEDEERYRYW